MQDAMWIVPQEVWTFAPHSWTQVVFEEMLVVRCFAILAIMYKMQNTYVALEEEQMSDPHCCSFSCVRQEKDLTFTSIRLIYVVDNCMSFESSYCETVTLMLD
jgi:hypothetical protein